MVSPREVASFNGDISQWDVPSSNGDISQPGVSSVTSMTSTFNSATSFNGDILNCDLSAGRIKHGHMDGIFM